MCRGFAKHPRRRTGDRLRRAPTKGAHKAAGWRALGALFDGLPGRPEFQCRVRHVGAMNGRCGVEFYREAARQTGDSLVRLAICLGGRMVPDVRTFAA